MAPSELPPSPAATNPNPAQLQPTPTANSSPSSSPPAPQRPASISDVITTIKPADILSVHQAPCSRSGFLTGIGSGAAIGGLRFILGSGVPKAANWAVGAGVLGAVLQYEYCQASRRAEREKMKRVVEVYDRKQGEMKREEDRRRVEREQMERLKEKEERTKQEERGWWKVW
ncbi:hypothetical protein GE09DRAFT_1289286 [Coniochaeta sp. 2T2.1]|nr:hypothetical protein GE09DRAFT_1289286 [Coniochaeta sp. 2T2.1]